MTDKHRRRYFAVPSGSAPNWVLLALAACAFVVSSLAGVLV